MPISATRIRSALLVSLYLASTGCGGNEYVPPPPPAVTVAQPVVADVVRYLEYTGTTRAVETVEIRARVEGFLQSMHFEAGEAVSAGQLLFIIDPEPFELELKAAEARVTTRRAELALADTEFERTRALYESKATSEIRFIQRRAKRDTATAELALAEADKRSAELNVEYANVTAPIGGRVGRHLVDIGNLVGNDGATPLTNVIQYSPLYVFFYISERDLLAVQETIAQRRRDAGTDWEHRPPTPVYVGRANDEGYPYEGTIDFSALAIDPQTGTFEVRAILSNEGELDEIIVPGTFVRVQFPVNRASDALLVPEAALGADQNGRFVMVVGDEGMTEQRSIQVGPERRDGLRVAERGLSADEWIIVKGLQRVRAGAPVAPEKTTLEPPAPPRAGSGNEPAAAAKSLPRSEPVATSEAPDVDASDEPTDEPTQGPIPDAVEGR